MALPFGHLSDPELFYESLQINFEYVSIIDQIHDLIIWRDVQFLDPPNHRFKYYSTYMYRDQ